VDNVAQHFLNLNSLDDVLRPDNRRAIETQALPDYLLRRRWFASKDKAIEAVHLARADMFAMANGAILLTEIDVHLAGRSERYQLPLGLAWDDDQASPLIEQLAVARVEHEGRLGYLTDAFALDILPLGLLAALQAHEIVKVEDGEVCATATGALAEVTMPEILSVRRISAEQSNSSLILGNAVIMKIIRRVMLGINPEVEMVRYLTERGYANTPPLLGEISRLAKGGTPQSMVVVQAFVANEGDAWEYTLHYLKTSPDALDDYAAFASTLGARLAQLHEVLAKPTDDKDFSPMPAAETDARVWAEGAAQQLAAAYETLRHVKNPTEIVARDAGFVLQHADAISKAATGLAQSGIGTMQTRIHGDFHLGQVLVADGDAYIIDFEGEPAKPLTVRRAKSSPMRDVAGLLRSFHYAAAAADLPQSRFVSQMSEAFLAAYHQVERIAAPRWVADEAAGAALLDLFLLEKSAYEICYEAANRPAWLAIPLRGFAEIAARVLKILPETPDA
jgi:maltose alpha-D-glucosyltransferase/alpha-amylase